MRFKAFLLIMELGFAGKNTINNSMLENAAVCVSKQMLSLNGQVVKVTITVK